MGVSISAYRKITRVEPSAAVRIDGVEHSIGPDEETLYEMGLRPAHCHPVHAAHALEGFPGAVLEDRGDIMMAGWYRPEDPYPEYLSRSYTGYGVLRERIWSAANPDIEIKKMWADPHTYADRPYWEMAFFADHGGTLGPVACANLAADFRDHDVSEALTDFDNMMRDHGKSYALLGRLFAHAADTGMVILS